MACSKYTITNSSSILTNFNYRRCDDSLWEYQAELGPSETKNIWTIDGTYSTAFANDIVIDSVTEFPITPTPEEYSQTALVVSLNTNNLWNYSILNWANETVIGNIDLGISQDYSYSVIQITNQGYVLFFYNDTSYEVIFMNSIGVIIDRYQTISSNIEFNTLTGLWSYVNDYDNGVCKYFNGSYLGTYTFNPSYELFVLYQSLSGGSFLGGLRNLNTNFETLILFSEEGVETNIKTYNNLTTPNYVWMDFNANFVCLLTTSSNIYTKLEIYNSGGELLQNISLTGNTYTQQTNYFYGTNKVLFLFRKNSSPAEWLVVNYDGNTDVVLTSIESGVIYTQSPVVSYQNYFFPTSTPSENLYLIFNSISGSIFNDLVLVTQAKILSFIDKSETIGSYVFQNSGIPNKSMGLNYIQGASTLFVPVNTGNNILSILSVNESGHTITSTGLSTQTTNFKYTISFGNNFGVFTTSTGACSENVFIYGGDGLLRDSLSNGVYDYITYSYDTLSIYNTCGGFTSYYINNQNPGFIETDEYFNVGTTQDLCYIPNFTYNGAMLLVNTDLSLGKIITPTSASETFSIQGDSDFFIGSNYCMSIKNSGSTLYDFNGNIININYEPSYSPECGYLLCYGAVSSRYYYINTQGESPIINLSSPVNNGKIVLNSDNYNLTLNDYIYNY